MKKIVYLTLLLASWTTNAQIFSEDFNSGLPSTWTVIDVDGLTPFITTINLSTPGWHAVGSSGNIGNTSWYDPTGIADDWLISPQISIPSTSTNPYLYFDESCSDGSYLSTYNILISTSGTSISDFSPLQSNIEATLENSNKYFDLSTYIGNDIHIAIQDISNDKLQFLIDDFFVEDLTENEISFESIKFNRYVSLPNTQSLAVTVKNKGLQNITAYTIKWNYNGTPYSYNVTGVDIALGNTHEQSINIDVTVTEPGALPFTIDLELAGDSDASNNTGEGIIYGMENIPTKRVVFEEATGSWCGWCPRGAVGLDNISDAEGDEVIGIAVHNGDPMAVAEHDNNMNVDGYPSANGDRKLKGFDPGNFSNQYAELKANVSPVNVSISAVHNPSTDKITVTPTFNFEIDLTGDFNVSIIIIEDWVHNTGNGYSQSNSYAGGGNGVMGGYELLPSPVPAEDMYYRHVSRGFLGGGFDGDDSVIPNTIVSGTNYSQDYEYTVPSDFAIGHLSFAALIVDNTTKEIINANKTHYVQNVVGINEFSNEFSLIPNPANDVFTLKSSSDVEGVVRIVNSLGQVMDTYINNTLLSGSTYDVSKYEAGIYYVTITEGNKIATKRLVIE